ncbi:MAG: hypothetical protein OEY86_01625 [Nitrospira sp.]|nr:hypothetical protein [Nitrospira sp.]
MPYDGARSGCSYQVAGKPSVIRFDGLNANLEKRVLNKVNEVRTNGIARAIAGAFCSCEPDYVYLLSCSAACDRTLLCSRKEALCVSAGREWNK